MGLAELPGNYPKEFILGPQATSAFHGTAFPHRRAGRSVRSPEGIFVSGVSKLGEESAELSGGCPVSLELVHVLVHPLPSF